MHPNLSVEQQTATIVAPLASSGRAPGHPSEHPEFEDFSGVAGVCVRLCVEQNQRARGNVETPGKSPDCEHCTQESERSPSTRSWSTTRVKHAPAQHRRPVDDNGALGHCVLGV